MDRDPRAWTVHRHVVDAPLDELDAPGGVAPVVQLRAVVPAARRETERAAAGGPSPVP